MSLHHYFYPGPVREDRGDNGDTADAQARHGRALYRREGGRWLFVAYYEAKLADQMVWEAEGLAFYLDTDGDTEQ